MINRFLIGTTLMVLSACASQGEIVSERDISKLQHSAKGVWASDGYGYIIDLNDGQTVYNISGQNCAEILADQENPMDYFDRFRVNRKKTQLQLFSEFERYPISFARMETLPKLCMQPPSTAPLDIYDNFVDIYAQHYGFFDVHGVNWEDATQEMRSGLNNESGEMYLVERFIGMLSQLRDGHVSIAAVVDGDEGEFIAYPGKTNIAIQESKTDDKNPKAAFGEQYLRIDIERDILGGHGFNAVNERIKYGITSGDIGYIAVMSEGGYTEGENPSFEQEIGALKPAMAQVIRTFKAANVKAVIIDLSVNYGGYDFLGREIAGSFTDTPVLAYSKYASDAKDKTPYKIQIKPAEGPRFTGPVYVMTSDMTVSAGEVTTLSLRALPNVTHVGMPTRGAFSDVLTKYLPNGWTVTLSNEVYTDSEGIVWEGKGIEPQVTIEVFDLENPLSGHLPAVNKLIGIIDERHSN